MQADKHHKLTQPTFSLVALSTVLSASSNINSTTTMLFLLAQHRQSLTSTNVLMYGDTKTVTRMTYKL